ncbi:Phosphopantetheine attachment site [Roseomonas rosea]|jgi:acyl carrier protein|uniref:Phosphopantetheine attachment site n=1 Tax=Muricoccus roseus TaxID=198092 RepID=A0A1M6B536_9PROT|nr:acyl carrier protein [Roseomonas rosea]SHI43841.1 Phosphopantetheine attachment site [Roseomonas rosea]
MSESTSSGTTAPGGMLPVSRAALRDWMVTYISKLLDMPPGGFPTAASFAEYGLDSVEAVVMAGAMEEEFGVVVDPMQFFENHSVDAFAQAYGQPDDARAAPGAA